MWHERLYGLMCCCLDVGLLLKASRDEDKRSSAPPAASTSRASASSSSTTPPATGTTVSGGRKVAWDLRKDTKHPVLHAFKMYADPENRARQWCIHVACEPLHKWHCEQNVALRDCSMSCDWLIKQCSGGYMVHIRETLRVLQAMPEMSSCGFEAQLSNLRGETVQGARCATQDAFAAILGDMCTALAASRLRWGLDILMGWPKRSCLLASSSDFDKAIAIAEVRRQFELIEAAAIDPTPEVQAMVQRSHLRTPPAVQVLAVLRSSNWAFTPQVGDWCERR